MEPYTDITKIIQQIANLLPINVLNSLVCKFAEIDRPDDPQIHRFISASIVEPQAKFSLYKLLDLWLSRFPQLTGHSIALALECAGAIVLQHRETKKIDIVWTGPTIHEINLRRTENVLLELIETAEQHLHIISFAVYKAKAIMHALLESLNRGVHISIYLETPIHSKNKVSYDAKRYLGKVLEQKANVYAWPLNKRESSPDGKHGSLHAKAAVADSRSLFISSANLTDYAMSLNIELGVLIQDEISAMRVEKQLRSMVARGIFVPI